MSGTLFDFEDPNLLLRRHPVETNRGLTHRSSGTIQNSVKHGIVHTSEAPATLHHTVIAASPHPTKNRADRGEFYMIAYVSIPMAWLNQITPAIVDLWDISFVGPSGTIQKLPPALADMEDLLNERVYLGVNWLWLGGEEPLPQPQPEYIKSKLIALVNSIREVVEAKK